MISRATAAALAALLLASAAAKAGDPAAGEADYEAVCANCHGPTGKGMASFPSLAGRDADYIAGKLRRYREGERIGPNAALMIPNARELSDEEIADLAAYVSTSFR